MHRIIVLERNAKAREVLATEEEIWVGRTRDFAIALRDRWVSRRHAVIRLRGGALFVEDLGSATGTIVNGRRLSPGKALQLQDGDVIICGASTLCCRLDPGDRPDLVDHPAAGVLEELVARANARLLALARGSVRAWPVASTTLRLGRSNACDIVISEEGVASEHARLFFASDGFHVENRSPFHQILVNGRGVNSVRLPSNSVVVLGLAQILFLYDYEPDGRLVWDPIEEIPPRRFRSYLAQQAQLLPTQVRQLKRTGIRSNVRLGEAAVRMGFITPGYWRSICSSALEDGRCRRDVFFKRIASWFRRSRRESESCSRETT